MGKIAKLVQKDPVDTLTAEWLVLKREEKAMQARRREVEDELLKHIDNPKEGTVHVNDRIKVQFKLTRKVDSDALDEIWDQLPDNIQKAFQWEAKPVLKELRKVQDDLWLDGIVKELEGRPTFVEKGD